MRKTWSLKMLVYGRSTIFSCVRLYYLDEHYIDTNPDSAYSLSFVTSAVEVNLAIIAASAPALWPLISRRFGSQTAISRQRYYEGSNSEWMRTSDGMTTRHNRRSTLGTSLGEDEVAIDLKDMRDRRMRTEVSSSPYSMAGGSEEEILPTHGESEKSIRKKTEFTVEVSGEDNPKPNY